MESISVFDIFKIGVGPSSSHTMGPWRAAQKFLAFTRRLGVFDDIVRVRTELFGSLAKTGHGHGTDLAVLLALAGEDPVTCPTEGLTQRVDAIKAAGQIALLGERAVPLDPDADLLFHMDQTLPFHPNGVRFTALLSDGRRVSETYYSVGGGFVVQEGEVPEGERAVTLRYPSHTADDLTGHVQRTGLSIPAIVLANESAWRDEARTRAGLLEIWRVMQACAFRGCHAHGVLPGGLNVVRRAGTLNARLTAGRPYEHDVDAWLRTVRGSTSEFRSILKWVAAFALAVNEENACFGRVVTAPTNGAAGVIPAVMLYYWCFCENSSAEGIVEFMLTAGEIGSLFKKGATISAAMGGCQAEIGVSSAMAAAGLTQALGGTAAQAIMAAEIAMEHHLGMTCDPIKGLVQIPCIERNTMGATKAITAANIALEGDPGSAKVSLDSVIRTMWQTAQDMQSKYKETSEGGLAVNVAVSEC